MMTPYRPKTEPDRRYTVAEAARILEVTPAAIYKWRKTGVIRPAVFHIAKTSGQIFIVGRDVVKIWEEVYL